MKLAPLDRLLLQLARQLSECDAEQVRYRLKFTNVDRESTSSPAELLSLLRSRYKTTLEFSQQLRELLCNTETKNKEQYRDILDHFDQTNGELGDESLHNRPSLALAASLRPPVSSALHLEFRRMLGRVAQRVGKKELEMMRTILVQTEADRRGITLTLHLFETLEKQGCFGPEDTEYLYDLFEVFEDCAALQSLNEYHKNHLMPPPPPRFAPSDQSPASSPSSTSPFPHTFPSPSTYTLSRPPFPSTPLPYTHIPPPLHTHSSSYPRPLSSVTFSHPLHYTGPSFNPTAATKSQNAIFPNETNISRKRTHFESHIPGNGITPAAAIQTLTTPSKKRRDPGNGQSGTDYWDPSGTDPEEGFASPVEVSPSAPPLEEVRSGPYSASLASSLSRHPAESRLVVHSTPRPPPPYRPDRMSSMQHSSINYSVTGGRVPVEAESEGYSRTTEIYQESAEWSRPSFESEECVCERNIQQLPHASQYAYPTTPPYRPCLSQEEPCAEEAACAPEDNSVALNSIGSNNSGPSLYQTVPCDVVGDEDNSVEEPVNLSTHTAPSRTTTEEEKREEEKQEEEEEEEEENTSKRSSCVVA